MKMNTTDVVMKNVDATSLVAKIDMLNKTLIRKSKKVKQLKSDAQSFFNLWAKELTDNLALSIENLELTNEIANLKLQLQTK